MQAAHGSHDYPVRRQKNPGGQRASFVEIAQVYDVGQHLYFLGADSPAHQILPGTIGIRHQPVRQPGHPPTEAAMSVEFVNAIAPDTA